MVFVAEEPGPSVVPSRYVPRLQTSWLTDQPDCTGAHRTVGGTLVFADVWGFTALSERLARRGRAGAEELTELINSVVCRMLQVIRPYGGDLLEYGGDALLLLFSGVGHERRASIAGAAMSLALREFRDVSSASGRVRLRMSIGIQTGQLTTFLAGTRHRELLLMGQPVDDVLELQRIAGPGEIVVGTTTVAALPPGWLGLSTAGGARRLRPREISTTPSDLVDSHERGKPYDSDAALDGIPPVLRNHLGAVDGEHRQIAVGFLHWSGLDAELRTRGPDALAATLHDLIDVTQNSCAEHGVTFLATDADASGITVVLAAGAPTTAADNEDRLVSVLRTVVDTPTALLVKAGAHRGQAFAVEVGDDERRIYTVLGETVNIAARMMAAAPDGGLLVTASVFDRLRLSYVREPIDPLYVKGIARPVEAALLGPIDPGTPKPAERSNHTELPFVGREAESRVLLDAIETARSGGRRVVDIIGEPGMGKSRLLAEALTHVGELPVLVVQARQYAKTEAFGAVREPLRQLIGAPVPSNDDQVAALLARTLERIPELRPLLPLVGVPFGVRLPDSETTSGLTADHRREELRAATIRLLLRVFPANGVLVIEDPYWLDEGSRQLLTGLAGVLPGWACIVTQRLAAPGLDLSGTPDVERLELGPLPPEAMASLASATGRLSPADTDAVAARSAGNPLFLQELTAAVAGGASIEELPDTVEAVIAAHLDTLPKAERDLVRIASVLGSDVPIGWLFELADIHDPEAGRTRLERASDILELANDRVRFGHALVRDSAYESLSFRRRRALHGKAADLIRSGHTDEAGREQRAALLSLHYCAAHRYQECWDWSLVAGERARHDAAPDEAVTLLRRALDSAKSAGIEPDLVSAVHEQLGDVADLAGRYGVAAEAYRRARTLRGVDASAAAELFRKQGHIAEQEGDYVRAIRLYKQGFRVLETASSSDDTSHAEAELTRSYGVTLLRQGKYAEAVPVLEDAARSAELGGYRAAQAHAYYLLDWAHTDLGRPDPKYRELALPIYEELGDWLGQGNVLINLGVDAYYEGRWLDAVEAYRRGRDAYERIGATVLGAAATNNIGEILCDQGHFAKARDELEQALEIWTASAYPGAGLAAANLGRVAAFTGAFETAANLLTEAKEALGRIGADSVVVDVELRELERLVLMSNWKAALELADLVRQKAEQPVQQALLERMAGWAHAQAGDYDTARAACYTSLRIAQRINARYEEARTRAALARLAIHRSERVAIDQEAETILSELGVVWSPLPPLPNGRTA